jgi:hypothetical protein
MLLHVQLERLQRLVGLLALKSFDMYVLGLGVDHHAPVRLAVDCFRAGWSEQIHAQMRARFTSTFARSFVIGLTSFAFSRIMLGLAVIVMHFLASPWNSFDARVI